MKRICECVLICWAVTTPSLAAAASGPEMPARHEVSVVSKTLIVDRSYLSMAGPRSNDVVSFSANKGPGLIWLTGFKAQALDPQTRRPLPNEFFCHSTLQFDKGMINLAKRDPVLGRWTDQDFKLVSLVQGITEIKLPEGFGIPVYADEPFTAESMVINPHAKTKPFLAQAKVTYSFFKDDELKAPLKPLVRRAIFTRVPVPVAQKLALEKVGCGFGSEYGPEGDVFAKPVPGTPWNLQKEKDGMISSYHWMVPPGRHQYVYVFPEKGLKIPYETTIHYIELHLHPYGTFGELKDLTTGKTIFRAKAKTDKKRNAIAKIGHYESTTGMTVYPTHQYAFISEYNNTTDREIDAMANFYYYFLNKQFDKSLLDPSRPPATGNQSPAVAANPAGSGD